MRTAVLAALSHDLRTPLATIKASVSSLRDRSIAWSEDDQAELLAATDEAADQLDGLLANLLDLSRLQTGVLVPLRRPGLGGRGGAPGADRDSDRAGSATPSRTICR